MTKATGSEVLFLVIYYEVKSCYINQANQVGFDKGVAFDKT